MKEGLHYYQYSGNIELFLLILKRIYLECFTDQANNIDKSTTQPKKGGSTKFYDFALCVSNTMTVLFSVLVSS